jgi:protein-tyrosine phosphatase
LLKKIFRSENNKQLLPDFSEVEVDFHSHLIPAIDDGVKTVEESIQILERFINYGFRKVITTPHVMSDYYKNDNNTISAGYQKVKEVLNQKNLDIEFTFAAEYYLDYEFVKLVRSNQILTLGDNYVLVEFSFFAPPENYLEIFFDLQSNGFKVILAHPERYSFLQSDKKLFEEIKDRNIFLQINGNSLLGDYNPAAKKTAEWLIDENYVDFIGSDTHNIESLDRMRALLYNKYFYQLLKSGNLKNNQL